MNTETQNPATTPKPKNTNHLSEWRKVKLGDFIEVKHGFAFKGKNIIDEKTENILVTPGNFHIGGGFKTTKFKYYNGTFPEEYILNEGDIIVTMTDLSQETNTLGYSAKVPKYPGVNFLHNQRIGLIEFKSQNVDKEFIYWLLRTDDYHGFIVGSASGTSIMHTSPSRIKEYSFLLPPLPEQQAIAEVLSSLDDKIDLLHRQNKTLEALAETLFRQWFVEPNKKIANESDSIEGFSNDKFSKWIIETVGGEWGKENVEGDFNKIVNCIRGTDIADLNSGLPMKTPLRFVKESKFKNIEPKEGDLMIEISGGTENQSTGRICYINQDVKNLFEYPIVFSNFCRLIRVKKPEYSFFLYCYIQYLYNQDEFFNLENGSSGIKNLDYKALLFELDYPMPNENLVLDFHNQVEPLFKKVNQNKIQIRNLTQLRDTLLPKLMSGEVRVDF